jgi:hypothetical protein
MPTDQLRLRFGIKWRQQTVEPTIPPVMLALLAEIDSSEKEAPDSPPPEDEPPQD